ncbi:multiple epidermal growth factor-like domains protein 11 [Ruditapes philippinarum]|uniref:multiple epidermal growth factor-like domains protein 11 n=1 Tax=Ruditapes philippinarum TaxID=129788 RepID=UPI00295B29E7|nr:multiple epidermal growth factor-like domains protein 11 [Ruditapes philippinarum]
MHKKSDCKFSDQGTFGLNCIGICNCKDDAECRKTDGNCSYGCAFGWSGFNCSKDLNLIKRISANVVTSQSSTYAPYQNPSDFNSSKAIDGVENYSVDTCKCCSVTNGPTPSWWQIDLKQRYLIGAIQIFGRESGYPEQLQHAVVYAGNASMASNMSSNKMKVYEVPNITDTRIFTNDLDPLIVQYFLVELPQKFLILCEFKLYEKECKVGYFGSGCLHGCHCSDNNTCNQVTGKCQTHGCLVGWKGEACTDRKL